MAVTNSADTLLLPPRQMPYILHDVLEGIIHGCRDEIVLDLGDSFLRFGVDIDTDCITSEFHSSPFQSTKGHASVKDAKPWKEYIGKECGWTWLGWDQQGYQDTVLLSFNGIQPCVLLQGMASSIDLYTLLPIARAIAGSRSNAKTNKRRPRV